MKDKYSGVYEVKDINGNIVKNKYTLRMCITVNGVTHRDTETVEATSKKKAYDIKIKRIAELKELYETGTSAKSKAMTFINLVDKWDSIVKSDIEHNREDALSYNTYATYKSTLAKYILPYFSSIKIAEITSGTIQNYLDYIKSKYSLSDKTIKNQFMLIRTLLSFAYQRDLIINNPCDKVKLSKIEAPEPHFFTDEQMAAIFVCLDEMVETKLASFETSRKYKELDPDEREKREHLRTLEVWSKRLFVHLSLLTGARRGETIGVMWKDIEMVEAVSVSFRGTTYHEVGVGSQYKDKLKNKSKLKVVYLTPQVIPLIKEYKALQKQVIKEQGWKDTGYVFLAYNDGKINKAGGLANGDTYTHWFSDFCVKYKEKIGLTDEEANKAHVHMLRHSFVTYELMNGTDIKTVAELAGHKDTNMTANRYGHVYDERKQAAASVFDNLYEQVNK